jgi:hypothetical protein
MKIERKRYAIFTNDRKEIVATTTWGFPMFVDINCLGVERIRTYETIKDAKKAAKHLTKYSNEAFKICHVLETIEIIEE